ncbi:hypothetical protein [Azohydromonas australica]|uniref:hypothetical protein n=1 Tax=Azohydromonas australica TaxID=364039 RepID=UPI0012EBBB4C|nr:hypothetical protein [Azohydromonas australica]
MGYLKDLFKLASQIPEVHIFIINVTMQVRVGMLHRQTLWNYARTVRRKFRELQQSPSWNTTPDDEAWQASLVWNMCEFVASQPPFAFQPPQRCATPNLPDESEALTVLTSQAMAQHYFNSGKYLESVPGWNPKAAKQDHEAFKQYLRSIYKSGSTTYLDPDLLKHSMHSKTLRGKAPFFWISPSGMDRQALTPGQLRDRLGLIHINNKGTWIVEISLSMKGIKDYFGHEGNFVIRPCAIGAVPGPRFRSVAPWEIRRTQTNGTILLEATGTTVDLESFACGAESIDGWPELLCKEAPWGPQDPVAREQWWNKFQPRIRVVGELTDDPRGASPVDSHKAFAIRLNKDFSEAAGEPLDEWLQKIVDRLGVRELS